MREYENELKNKNVTLIAGVDEAGRGPIAGPVVAAAVILPLDFNYELINDSKKLTEKQREQAFEIIKENAIAIGIGIVDHIQIDKINILEATKLAMTIAINKLNEQPEHVLIDAVKLNLDIPSQSIIKGDAKSISIAAASIIAKVTRDKMMVTYDTIYPNYGFSRHKGYPTKAHKEAVNVYGPCEIHRKTFAPINKYFIK